MDSEYYKAQDFRSKAEYLRALKEEATTYAFDVLRNSYSDPDGENLSALKAAATEAAKEIVDTVGQQVAKLWDKQGWRR